MALLTKEEQEDLHSSACESFHTAFRKGADGGGSDVVHKAISDMADNQWGSAISWAIWAIGFGKGGYYIVPKDKFYRPKRKKK